MMAQKAGHTGEIEGRGGGARQNTAPAGAGGKQQGGAWGWGGRGEEIVRA